MAEQIDVLQEKMNWHWRNSMRSVRFFAVDGRAAMPLPLLLVYARWSTLILFVVSLVVFRYLEQKGLSFPSALRALRSWMFGKYRPGVPGLYQRIFRDFG